MGVGKAKADGAAAVAQMKAMPTDDDAFGPASIRRDGQALLPVYLFKAKTPAESKGSWDLYKLEVTSPPDQAWQPEDKECPLVHV
jgi:branched-chain amino acid transport system substrate-binding protein